MQKRQLIVLVVFCICIVTVSFGQRKTYQIKNGFGIYGGITQYDIITDNFTTKKGNGWQAGASATVDIPHKWYNVSYTIQLSENNIGILAQRNLSNQSEFVEYKIFTAQVALMMHVKLIQSFLTIDVGPMIQYNSDLELKNDEYEDFNIVQSNIAVFYDWENNTANVPISNPLKVGSFKDISNFNINGAIGVSAGYAFFRLKAQYIYGFTNILNKLNEQDLNPGSNNNKFKGNQSMFAFTAMITF